MSTFHFCGRLRRLILLNLFKTWSKFSTSFFAYGLNPYGFYKGVKFEPNSFKLTHEMVTLMGGRDSQGYALFQRLTVKGFLAIRPYADQIIEVVRLMLGTEFPSFKGEPTIKRLRDRFALDLNERTAADYMAGVIKNAHENVRSTVYDEFQRVRRISLALKIHLAWIPSISYKMVCFVSLFWAH
jgi:hypothetical protein